MNKQHMALSLSVGVLGGIFRVVDEIVVRTFSSDNLEHQQYQVLIAVSSRQYYENLENRTRCRCRCIRLCPALLVQNEYSVPDL